jgi:hypothetical protein
LAATGTDLIGEQTSPVQHPAAEAILSRAERAAARRGWFARSTRRSLAVVVFGFLLALKFAGILAFASLS